MLTLLLARACAINCLVSDSGTPSAIIATTLIVGCFNAVMEEAAALQVSKHYSELQKVSNGPKEHILESK